MRSRKQVSSHLQTLKRALRVPLQATFGTSQDWISEIVSFTQYESDAMHNTIYDLLHNEVLDIDNELGTLESVTLKALGPAYRSAIRRIFITTLAADLRQITDILHIENFHCLRRLTVRIYDQSGLHDPPLSAEAKGDFVKVLRTANPKAEVNIFADMEDSRVRTSDLCDRSAYDAVVQELKERRVGASVVSAVSGLDIDSEDEETGLRAEEEILHWIRGVRSGDGED